MSVSPSDPDPVEDPVAPDDPVPETDPEPGAGPDESPTPDAADATDATDAVASEGGDPPAAPKGLRGLLAKVPVPRPETRRGAVLLMLACVGVGAIALLGGVWVVHWTESTEFCTMCHPMIVQKKAHEASPHALVECGACHVAPGPYGFIKAKLEGTHELYALATNTLPRPIPPIEHAKLPSTEVTCQECHPLNQLENNNGPSRLVLRTTFADDEKNSRKDLAVLLRPAHAGTSDARSVHWHVETPVTFTSDDEHLQSIDSVEYTDPKTGELEQFLAVSKIRQSNQANLDIERLKATEQVRTMDCADCHNRVGHGVPTVQNAIDDAMASGKIDATLPYVKRTGVALLTKPYDTAEAGEKAIDGLSTYYAANFPAVAAGKASQIAAASTELKSIYNLITTPDMKAGNNTYPNNLGHQSAPGCFRCHDGAHYKVVKGIVTTETIPSTCDTCHTFPQIAKGSSLNEGTTSLGPSTGVPIGEKPADHNDGLWVFNHRNVAGSVTPNKTSCGVCHTASYCENCHNSGAIKIDHYTMLYDHAASVRAAGGTTSCAVCHQTAYCEQCHKNDVLGPSNSHLDKPGG